jgi:transposase
VRAYLAERFGVRLGKSGCLRYLHRLGFVWKRPKKRLTKADAAQRAAFVREYLALVAEAERTGAKIFFVDEAHFRADGDLRGRWVRKGTPALVDSSSPRWGEKASYYSAVCLETGEVEAMELAGTSSAETSAAFLRHLRAAHPGPLIVIWDNGPAHGGDALRAYLATPGLRLRLVRLPAYSPDDNADEAIWDWIREEVTANTCFGTAAKVRAHVDAFFRALKDRTEEVKTRCRTVLQADARALQATTAPSAPSAIHRYLGTLLHAPRTGAQEVTTHCRPAMHPDRLALAGV